MSIKTDNPLTPVTARGEATRRKLLNAAEIEFGSKGYHNASISSITLLAGVGLGTFYLYFRSKEEAYYHLVQYMGEELRHALKEAVTQATDFPDMQRAGLRAFIGFVRQHSNLYRLVQESLFIDEKVYRDYYQSYASIYEDLMGRSAKKGLVTPGDAEARAWAVLGLGHSLGLRYGLWEVDAEKGEQALETIVDLLVNGLMPR